MREAFDRRRREDARAAVGHPGVTVVEPEGAFYAFPSFERRPGPRWRTPVDRPSSWPRCVLDEAKVAIVPGEAFGAPGYARLSYALGDDELEEGLSGLAEAGRRLSETFGPSGHGG